MTLFKFKTFGANIYIIPNIIYNKYNYTFDEMDNEINLSYCSYHHSYFGLEAKSPESDQFSGMIDDIWLKQTGSVLPFL